MQGGKKPLCKFGANCNKFLSGNCTFYHPPNKIANMGATKEGRAIIRVGEVPAIIVLFTTKTNRKRTSKDNMGTIPIIVRVVLRIKIIRSSSVYVEVTISTKPVNSVKHVKKSTILFSTIKTLLEDSTS
jgi:hypothetical protein